MMSDPGPSRQIVCFGAFQADLRSFELRKGGIRIKIQEQPFRVLQILLEHPGEMVTREELQRRIWPSDTFVDFDRGLNNAVKRLREALGDSAETPRYIETLARRGYRFLASLDEAHVSPAKRGGPIDSIAVLPLENSTGDPDTDFLALGIPGSIIQSLSQIYGLRVIAWSTVAAYRNQESDPQAIGRRLGVRAVLVGKIWQRANKLRLQVDLVDAANGEELWGDQYDRDVTEVFVVQDEISREVSQKLRLKLTGEEAARLSKRHTGDIEAYQLYVRGRRNSEKRSVEGFKKGIECLNEAIQKDPGYALAYAELSQCLHMPAYYGSVSPHDVYPKARAVALHALAMDETLAEARDTLATILQNYDWDWAASQREYKRAIELNANYPVARLHYAMHLAELGRFEDAIREAREGQRRDPMSGIMNAGLAFVLVAARQFDACIEQSHTAIDVDPNVTFTYLSLGAAYEQKGMYKDAVSAWEKGIALGGGASVQKAMIGHSHAVSGDDSRAREVLQELQSSCHYSYVPSWCFAVVYEGLGETELAIESLRKAVENREAVLVTIKVWPHFDKLRDHPHFQEIERRIGLRK
jgi:TolB-like protein/Flp pilus assembly protein TadD